MILLTGATGLIGRFIAEDLISKGVSFRALKRNTSTIPENIKYNQDKHLIDWVDGDIRSLHTNDAVFKDIDKIVHCAAIISFYSGDYEAMWKTNVEATANLVDIALARDIKRFVYFSSVAALGKRGNHTAIDEETPWYKTSNKSYYAETKYMAELEVWRGFEEGLPVVILNPSTVLGPSEWNSSSTRIFKYVWDENKFYPDGNLNYVDVRDVTSIALEMLQNEVIGERFILNAGIVSYQPLFEKIALNFNKKAPSRRVNYRIMSWTSYFNVLLSKATGRRPTITPEMVRLSKQTADYKNDKIKSFLNFDFNPLEDTIVWTCKELLKFNSS